MYPYLKKIENTSHQQHMIGLLEKALLLDLASSINLETTTLIKVRKLFYFIAHTSPSDLNYTSLAKKIDISKNSLENILHLLHSIGIVTLLPKYTDISNVLRKEYKIFL